MRHHYEQDCSAKLLFQVNTADKVGSSMAFTDVVTCYGGDTIA